jgi:hypothetical protein
LQILAWCSEAYETVLANMCEEEQGEEFALRPVDANILQKFLKGTSFHPILVSLDANEARVIKRQEKEAATETFTAYRREMGARELCRWLDNNKEFDPEEFDDVTPPVIPLPYAIWQEIDACASAKDELSLEAPVFSEAIKCLLSYVHGIHWKIDWLLENCRTAKVAHSDADVETLKSRFPFLHDCHPSVWSVPNTTPLMLSRTPGVHTTSPVHDSLVMLTMFRFFERWNIL